MRGFYRLSIVCLFGLVSLQARAAAWFPFGPDGGDARAFAADPKEPAHLYLGAANGWIYQSHDGGGTWERLARVGQRDDLVIDNILVDPADTKHLLVGAWAPGEHTDGGIFISVDGGATWAAQEEMKGQSVRALTEAPSDPKIMVAGSLDGVFRSTDSGEHWARISEEGSKEIHEVESLAIDPTDPNTIYAGTWHLPWKTTDAGKTWVSIKQGIIEDSDVFSMLVDPKQPSVVYASACSGIYKSEDGGGKFEKALGIPSDARRTRVLVQDPNHLDTVFAGTTEGLYRTYDGGSFWLQTTRPDLIVNDVYVDPANSKHVLLATDREGVWSSDDGGDSFTPSNKGFSARQIAAYVSDAQRPSTLYVGVLNDKEWGGVFVSETAGLSWSQLSDGLNGNDVFSLGQAQDGTILAGTGHGIYRLHDERWQWALADETATTPVAVPAIAAPKPARSKVANTPAARRRAAAKLRAEAEAAEAAAKAAAAAPKGFTGSVYGFAVSGETIYAATAGGVLRSSSNGATWSAVDAVPSDEWRFVAAAKTNVAAASLTAIEMSKDSGATWQAVALPAKVDQVSALAVDGRGGVWVAGREGVFVSRDVGANWTMLDDMYVRNINSLYYDEALGRMLVTSNGPATEVFEVSVATLQVTTWEAGWNLRFVRPVGDHMVGATLFDGIVVQPRMVDSALVQSGAAVAEGGGGGSRSGAEVAQH
jgi:ligand-binding sensor domain-containing protein